MRRAFFWTIPLAHCAVAIGLGSAPALSEQWSAPPASGAITRGLEFLQKDAADWKTRKQCANCHHGVMTLWAYIEGQREGYPVPEAVRGETAQWVRTRLEGIDKPRDPRPGWGMISTPALFLAAMHRTNPGLGVLSAQEQSQIAAHAGRHLEDDGSVLTPATMAPPRPVNGPPPVFESREILTLFARLAMLPPKKRTGDEPSGVREASARAAAYLDGIAGGEDTQALVLKLLVALEEGKARKSIRRNIQGLLQRQDPDGGWSQVKGIPSDAFATGQVLWVLRLAGVERKRPEIQRGVSFLVANQQANGSWPMTSRAHPGVKPAGDPVPITHFGSCWAVIGLARSVPNPGPRVRS